MKSNGFYTDIKESIEKHFSFLKAFGFSAFEEKQLAYEFHFEAKNDAVLIDIWFEATTSTPIWMIFWFISAPAEPVVVCTDCF